MFTKFWALKGHMKCNCVFSVLVPQFHFCQLRADLCQPKRDVLRLKKIGLRTIFGELRLTKTLKRLTRHIFSFKKIVRPHLCRRKDKVSINTIEVCLAAKRGDLKLKTLVMVKMLTCKGFYAYYIIFEYDTLYIQDN